MNLSGARPRRSRGDGGPGPDAMDRAPRCKRGDLCRPFTRPLGVAVNPALLFAPHLASQDSGVDCETGPGMWLSSKGNALRCSTDRTFAELWRACGARR